ncbi:polysaccharide deacetylase family protein [Anoxybacillus flavithermus]|nr:polysaccharide deacetylase family protein [Anoxybacillus flavithermus]MBE2914279.1 polysaccharide deacetylase family protein [Anoxybacillus flavithermus]MBE2916922.1 polysaccharide deacetylase family protein [Anoxybacillus flavithermus]MBE2922519.1 polysaccharide deacetylase family protein [Anoxybacillus flavithermus]MBE2941161.1 polysaccharide deacetylase family protein [Anoxybacillus flavithermus]
MNMNVFSLLLSLVLVAATPVQRIHDDIVWHVPVNEKMVAITFDDGPDMLYTPDILAILKQYDAKATFFVVGFRAEKYPDIIKRQIEEGHEIANHTYEHRDFRGQSKETIVEEIQKTEEVLYNITGKRPTLFRPPLGYYNQRILNIAKEQGYTVVMWSKHQDTYDWQNPGTNRIVRRVIRHIQPGQIILFHDHGSGSRKQTVQALKEILPILKQKGYTFVTVSELLKHHPNYRDLNL